MLKNLTAALLGMALLVGTATAQVTVDPNLPEYKRTQGVSGSIKSEGSDTMNNLMTLWAEGFKKMYPNVKIEITGKGTSTAPPALISGAATFGPMSREMKPSEADAFEEKFGYKPTLLGTSIDMLAVYVHKDNPIAQTGLTFPQVDAIFSSTRALGHKGDIRTWGQVGLTGQWANKPISMYGRNSASGTYGYFKENALGKGDYKSSVKEQPGSSAVIQGVANDKAGIGYSGIGYKTADVAVVPLAKTEGADFIPAEPANAYNGKYPMARFLWLSVNYKPNSQLDPLRREFLKYIYSKQGQEAVLKDGYFPVNAAIAKRQLAAVGIE